MARCVRELYDEVRTRIWQDDNRRFLARRRDQRVIRDNIPNTVIVLLTIAVTMASILRWFEGWRHHMICRNRTPCCQGPEVAGSIMAWPARLGLGTEQTQPLARVKYCSHKEREYAR